MKLFLELTLSRIKFHFFTSPLGCTDLEQQAQNQSLGQILNDMANLDVSTLQYPVRILLVRLCDGSTVYILEQFLDDLEGSHLVIGTITVTSAGQIFNVTAIQPEPIFAMAFNHEANGKISRAEWQTTFHRSQFYNYSYDALNRLSSGIYGEVVPTYNFAGGNFLKFAYQVNNKYDENSLTYSLPRSAGTWTATSKPCNAWGHRTPPIAPQRCRLIIYFIR